MTNLLRKSISICIAFSLLIITVLSPIGQRLTEDKAIITASASSSFEVMTIKQAIKYYWPESYEFYTTPSLYNEDKERYAELKENAKEKIEIQKLYVKYVKIVDRYTKTYYAKEKAYQKAKAKYKKSKTYKNKTKYLNAKKTYLKTKITFNKYKNTKQKYCWSMKTVEDRTNQLRKTLHNSYIIRLKAVSDYKKFIYDHNKTKKNKKSYKEAKSDYTYVKQSKYPHYTENGNFRQTYMAGANKNEKGGAYNGKAGDQTKEECYIKLSFSRPWTYFLEPKNTKIRHEIANNSI
ncbi:MAG: hypothetical protein HUJ63_07430, partial [Enterococcus sp.]|nr:hypothetical protein [Enterococcus sp.]